MDFVSQRHLVFVSHAHSPCITPPNYGTFTSTTHPSPSNYSFLVILVIGMMFTSFFLVGYYMLVVKCCLNWPHVDHVRNFSLSRHVEDPSAAHSAASEPRGLEEAVIKLIPVVHYKPEFGERSFISTECSVCLNEFQQDEKLRVIPNCSHVFHVDCIDVWLQSNAHCPLCRRTVSLTSQLVHVDQVNPLTPRPSPQVQRQNNENLIGGGAANEGGFVVINLDGENHIGDQGTQEELPTCPFVSLSSQRKVLEEKKPMKLQKVTSMGDECIGVRAKDERFSVQAMRRSFSMDSSVDGKFYAAIQQAFLQQQQQNGNFLEVSTIEGSCGDSDRVKTSLFSFGHGTRSRTAVLPVYLDP